MPLLRHRSSSRILTQSLLWWNMYGQYYDYFLQLFNDVELYWLPSVLGLKAECARDSKPNVSQKRSQPLSKMTTHCEYQTWRLAIGVQVRFDKIHRDVLSVFDKIAECCFYPRNTRISAYEGKAICTTLTYYLLLRQYANRCCIPADEIFEFLLKRTCDKYRAYATAIRTLQAMFTDGTYVDTYEQRLTSYPAHYIFQSHLPMLQLLIIDHIDRDSIDEILREINANTQCNLGTGIIRLSRSGRTFPIHLIDNFAFRKAISATNVEFMDTIHAHMTLAQNALLHFVLPSSFVNSGSKLGLLIDTHSWYLFSIIDLSSPHSIVHSNASLAINVRDAVCSCLANITDRNRIYADNGSKNSILLTEAHETKFTY
ncbi:unnamed protein product [Rotaria sp. Silwood1]|nr:unnamed protein product [Rotaria sp. Silwood1]